MDADDFVHPKMYQSMYDEAVRTNADIIFVDILCLKKEGKAVVLGNPVKSWRHKDILDAMIYKLFGSLNNRLVRKSLIEKYKVNFSSELHYMEDKLFVAFKNLIERYLQVFIIEKNIR